MKRELTQEDADELTTESAAALGELVEAFMIETGLRFGYTLLTFDRNGIKTMGNMPQAAQMEMFAFVASQLATSGPDDVETVKFGKPERNH